MKSRLVKSTSRRPAAAAKSIAKPKRKARRAAVEKAGAAILTGRQIGLLRQTFALVAGQSTIAAMTFYRNLFAIDPSLRAMFHTSIELQGRKLMDALQYTIMSLEKPAELVPALEAMGRRHFIYGVRNEQYATVLQAMLQTLGECLGKKFTAESAQAWRLALDFVAEMMQRGAAHVLELRGEAQPLPPLKASKA